MSCRIFCLVSSRLVSSGHSRRTKKLCLGAFPYSCFLLLLLRAVLGGLFAPIYSSALELVPPVSNRGLVAVNISGLWSLVFVLWLCLAFRLFVRGPQLHLSAPALVPSASSPAYIINLHPVWCRQRIVPLPTTQARDDETSTTTSPHD